MNRGICEASPACLVGSDVAPLVITIRSTLIGRHEPVKCHTNKQRSAPQDGR
jgi:hypothetical protein